MALVKMLHITDIHCRITGLERLVSTVDPDVIAVTGDFECMEPLHILLTFKDKKEIIAVPGNMDPPHIVKYLKEEGITVDGKIKEVKGLVVAGIGGIDYYTSLNKISEALRNKKMAKIDILLSHHPPKGVVDRTVFNTHIGLKALRSFVEEYAPKLHLCGHVHEARGIGQLGNTIIVNPGPFLHGYYSVVFPRENTYPLLSKI